MISIDVTLLAVGLGIYLLILIKTHNLGNFYKVIVALYLLLSFGYNMCLMARGIEFHQKVKDITVERPLLK